MIATRSEIAVATVESLSGMSVEEYFATGPPWERPIYDAVMAHVSTLGPVHPDAVQVGIFLKNPRKFAELRPMTKWVAVSFSLDRTVRSSRIARKVIDTGTRRHHVVNVRSADEVDDELLGWLAESYGFVE